MSGPHPNWPADDSNGTLGDGRCATRTEHPATVAEVQAAVRRAGAEGLAVYPQGGGTALDHGGIPARPGVAIRLGKLDRVVDYPVADMTITVEAGTTLAAIRELVGRHGQRLAIEAADPDRATLGGIFATATTGPRRFGWGRPRDQIIGVAFVTGDGELVRGGGRVVKNVAGYDFPKLLTGSLGTLGIITELTLKVNPRPESSALVSVEFKSLAEAAVALDRLNVSGTRPIALELVGYPGPPGGQGGVWGLWVGFEGNFAAVDWQLDRLTAELGRPARSPLREDAAERFWRDLVNSEANPTRSGSFVASFAPSRALRFLDQADLDGWSIRVHAGNGVVRGVLRSADNSLESWAAHVGRLRSAAELLGGSLIVTTCPIACKTHELVWGPTRPDWALAERVKAALDPGRVLNPGRFVGSI